MIQKPLSSTEAADLERSLSGNVVERVAWLRALVVAAAVGPWSEKESSVIAEGQECRKPVGDVSAAQVEANAIGNEGDDGKGIFFEEERRNG